MQYKSSMHALALAALLTSGAAVPAPLVATLADSVRALAPAVEAAAAETRPRHWPLKRACLYYAIAGQALLARQGIPARLRIGQVVYQPGTRRAHAIRPHAWLEVGPYFVDYAAIPRWGDVAVIPADMVAVGPLQVQPGVSRVLAIGTVADAPLVHYLRHHFRCFRLRWTGAQSRR
jgi:hypothetical protein